MIVVGAVLGLILGGLLLATWPVVGTVIATVFASILGPVLPVVALVGGLLAPLGLVLPTLPLSAWVFVAVFATVLVYVLAYAVATIAVAAAIPAMGGGSIATNAAENMMRGLMIGLTSALNLGLWVAMGSAPMGFTVAAIGLLTAFPVISRNAFFQAVLGWASWFMPLSQLATALGLILFILNLPAALATGGPGAIRFDVRTATIESAGGVVAVSAAPGFNLGNFSFLRTIAGQTPFGAPGLSAHETGHTITVAAFGGVFHWIDAIDENVPPFVKLTRAYGEMIAESHIPGGGFPWVGVWSP